MAGVLYSLAGRALVNLSFATAGECPVQIEAGLSDAEATETLKSVNVTRWAPELRTSAPLQPQREAPEFLLCALCGPPRSLREITRPPAAQAHHYSAKQCPPPPEPSMNDGGACRLRLGIVR
jgi:hypothetical protein